MRYLRTFLAAGALALAASLTPANAAPLTNAAKAVPADSSAVTKVHGWHRYCAWGPYRYHRHVPGYGWVPCHRYRRYYWGDGDYYGGPRFGFYWGPGWSWRHHHHHHHHW